eukprot:1682739-Amphidinium_carterae.11
MLHVGNIVGKVVIRECAVGVANIKLRVVVNVRTVKVSPALAQAPEVLELRKENCDSHNVGDEAMSM